MLLPTNLAPCPRPFPHTLLPPACKAWQHVYGTSVLAGSAMLLDEAAAALVLEAAAGEMVRAVVAPKFTRADALLKARHRFWASLFFSSNCNLELWLVSWE